MREKKRWLQKEGGRKGGCRRSGAEKGGCDRDRWEDKSGKKRISREHGGKRVEVFFGMRVFLREKREEESEKETGGLGW